MLLALFIVTLITFITYIKWRQTYWQRKHVPVLNPKLFVGDLRNLEFNIVSFSDLTMKAYRKLKQRNCKYGGLYFFWAPIFIPLDPDLIKHIMQKDFSCFTSHGMYSNPKDVTTRNLFSLEGEKWKNLRAKLTPTFTSGKMKMMFETVMEKTAPFETLLREYQAKGEPFAIKDLLARFTIDIIGSCAFGIECNSMEEADNIFKKYGDKILNTGNMWRLLITMAVPSKILEAISFQTVSSDINNFYINLVKDTINSRESKGIFRKDFLQLLMDLKRQDQISEDDIIGQCIMFFLAGFETSSTTMTFALLLLCQNLDIQAKLREEIRDVVEKHEGNITYDCIMDMEYLDQVINETLRIYPPAAAVPRVCTKSYKIPGTNITLEKGTRVSVPIWGLHMDPEYYPEPAVFDPDRFSQKNRGERRDFIFLPFGEGPRMCIGLRFGMLQIKVGLVSMLRKFKFTLSNKTKQPIEMDPRAHVLSVKEDVWVNAHKIYKE